MVIMDVAQHGCALANSWQLNLIVCNASGNFTASIILRLVAQLYCGEHVFDRIRHAQVHPDRSEKLILDATRTIK